MRAQWAEEWAERPLAAHQCHTQRFWPSLRGDRPVYYLCLGQQHCGQTGTGCQVPYSQCDVKRHADGRRHFLVQMDTRAVSNGCHCPGRPPGGIAGVLGGRTGSPPQGCPLTGSDDHRVRGRGSAILLLAKPHAGGSHRCLRLAVAKGLASGLADLRLNSESATRSWPWVSYLEPVKSIS